MLVPGANSTAEMAAVHLAVAAREPFMLRVTLRDGSSSRFVHLDFRCGLPPPHFLPLTLSLPVCLPACLRCAAWGQNRPLLPPAAARRHSLCPAGRSCPPHRTTPHATPPPPPTPALSWQAGHQRPPERWHPPDWHPQFCSAQCGRGRGRRPLQGRPLLCSGAGGCAVAAAEAAR